MFRDWLADRLSVARREYHNNFAPQHTTLFVRLKAESMPNRVMKRMGASGVTVGSLVMVRHDVWDSHMRSDPKGFFTPFEKHEMAHHWQVLRCRGVLCRGVLCHGFCYFGIGVGIYLFKWSKHPYYDHPMEIEARKLAGQALVDWRAKGKRRWWPFAL